METRTRKSATFNTLLGPRRKKYVTQKPAKNVKKCDCAYCGLSGGTDETKKTPSLVGNPKYARNTPSANESSRVVSNGSLTIEKKTSTEGSSKRIISKPEPEDLISTKKKALTGTPIANSPSQKERHECVCGNSYSRRDHLQRHAKFCEIVKANSLKSSSTDVSKIKCECGIGFDCVYNLVRHKAQECTGRIAAGKPFKCECRLVFDDHDSLLRHQQSDCKKRENSELSAKSVKEERSFSCECGLSYSLYSSLSRHRNTACILNKITSKIVPNELTCECGQKFCRASDLSRHKNVCDLREDEFDSDVEIKEEDDDGDCLPLGQSSDCKEGNISKSAQNSSGKLLCRCGESFKSYSALLSHAEGVCGMAGTFEEGDGAFFACGCGREFSRRCHLGRHLMCCTEVDEVVKVGIRLKEEKATCECGASYRRQDCLNRHRRTTCPLQKKSKLKVKILKSKTSANKCKCGAQFTMPRNLRRHINKNCLLYKPKPTKPTGKRQYRRKAHIRGSEVVHSKTWGTVRGPPFVCECGASYLNYCSFASHKKNTCKNRDAKENTKSHDEEKPQKKPGNSQSGLTQDYPNVDQVFDLSTALKFKCVCGQAFYSKFSLNGHSRHCKDFLAKKYKHERCTICKATFRSRALLVRHVKSIHCGVSKIKVGAKVKKIIAKSPKSSPTFQAKGLVIENVRSLAD